MIPFDTKDYRAPRSSFGTSVWCILGIIAIVMLLGWMGDRDREAHVKLVQEAAAARCVN
ncbi:MAG: hypothetical protein HRU77_04370 [Gammaproteobacteria bacterium]|nr:MAG: hypothetical protein HRU77_04370 [Gammaproteobacteria bacterium]